MTYVHGLVKVDGPGGLDWTIQKTELVKSWSNWKVKKTRNGRSEKVDTPEIQECTVKGKNWIIKKKLWAISKNKSKGISVKKNKSERTSK